MAPPAKTASRFSAWFPAGDDRRAFKAQFAVVFVIITLLELGYYRTHRLIEIDNQLNLQRAVRGWDGLAWYVWLVAAPATLLLIRRFPLNREPRGRNLLGLFLGSIAIYALVTNLRYLLRLATGHIAAGPTPLRNYLDTEAVLLPMDFITYCGFFATSFAIDYYFQIRQRAEEVLRLQLEAVRLRAELTQSQLATLRGQLHPHFLFNAFNAVSTLVRARKNEAAVDMIAQLSSLLRQTMDSIDQQEQTLGQELAFISSYLEVERVRFSDKLRTELDVPAEIRGCAVPNLLLQPLVENAIKHGVSRRTSPGCVRVTGARHGDRLHLEVADDGPGLPEPALALRPGGIGLRNTRSRLQHAYGGDFALEISRRPEGGTSVRLDLPWREKLSPAPALADFNRL
ncbi:MAG TPA: histidine kinase [Opitutaceae bacterium]|nr:histidine kinase [Opitutaceae bacterium]